MTSILDLDVKKRYHKSMKKRYKKMVEEIFAEPAKTAFRWCDMEKLLRKGLGATLSERAGARVVVLLNDRVAVFCREFRRAEMDEGAVKAMRRFLENSGVAL